MLTEKQVKYGGIAALAVLILALLVWSPWSTPQQEPQEVGHGGPLEIIPYPSTLGTASVPVVLTTGTPQSNISSVYNAGGLPNVVIGLTYTPGNYGSMAYIFVERSLDGGSTYMPYTTITPESGDIIVNTKTTSTPFALVTSRASGTPYIVGADNTSASGTPIRISWDMTMAADYVRVSAMEYTTGTSPNTLGRLNLQTYFTSN